MQYDGGVYIKTEINTKSAKIQLATLENSMVKTANKIASLRSKMDSLKDAKVPTQAYKDLEAEISKAEKEMEKMLSQDRKLADVDARIKKLSQTSAEYAAKIKEAESANVPTQNYKALQSDLDELIKKQGKLNEEIKEFDNVKNKEKIPLYKDLYFQLNDINKNIEHTTSLMKIMEDEGTAFTSAIDTSKVEALKAKQEAVNQELEKQKFIHSEIAQKQAESVQKVIELKAQMQQLVDEGKAFTLGSETEEYAKLSQQLEYAERELSVLNEKRDLLKLKQQQDAYKRLSDAAKKAFNSVGNTLKKLNSLVDSFGKRIKSAFSKLGKSAKDANKGLSGVSLSLKNILKYGFGIRSLYVLVNKLRSGLKEGFENLLTYSKSLENSVNSLKATALTLKNAFAAAFSPFVEIALPYVQKLLDYMVDLVNIAGQFFAALTGRKSYIRAIKQTTDALEDENAAMNKQLSGLDKLNNLSSQQGGKDAGTGGTMFEEVPIENGILDAAEKIKDILSKLFDPLKKAWEQEGQFVMDSWKYALEEVWKLIKDIGRDFMIVWNEDATVAVLANILHIIGDIGLIVGNLARNFREAWNTNQVGLEILRNIRDVIGIIVQHIRNMADATVEWADKLNFYPILDAFERFLDSIKPVVDAIWGIIEDFYVKVILPLSKWTVEKGLPDLLQVFIDFNNKVDWESLRKNLAEFWEHLEPFAETVGEGLILFIRRVSDALADFLNSQEFKDFLKTVEDWMDSVSPEDVADALELIAKGLIALKLAVIGFSAIKGISEMLLLFKALKFFSAGGAAGASAGMSGAATAAAGLSTALMNLLAVFEVVAAAVAGWEIGSWIAEKLGYDPQPFKDTMQGIKDSFTDGSWKEALDLWGQDIHEAFLTLGERQAETWESIKESIGQKFEEIRTNIANKLNDIKIKWFETWGSFKEKVTSAFGSIKTTVGSILDWIKSKIESIKSAINGLSGHAKSVLGGGLGGALGNAFKNYSIDSGIQVPVSPVVAALSNVEIPAYATGQVIPRTMKQHLAILGDNSQETEIVSPLSTMKQAVIEALSESEFSGIGGDVILNITAELDGEIVFNKMQKLDRQFYKQNGRHAFT